MKHFGELFFFLVVVFAVWIFVGSTPDARIGRACEPAQWIGHAMGSAAMAGGTDYGQSINGGSNELDYRCKLAIWDYFYADEWEKAHPGQPLPGQPRVVAPIPVTQQPATTSTEPTTSPQPAATATGQQ
ncbi:MAG: hypothetical protein M0Z50_17195 [Planctomycetia bacterium]|nr:hypothetical protein [Planctomycetia bacterium]